MSTGGERIDPKSNAVSNTKYNLVAEGRTTGGPVMSAKGDGLNSGSQKEIEGGVTDQYRLFGTAGKAPGTGRYDMGDKSLSSKRRM